MGVRTRTRAENRKEAKKSVAFAKLNNCPTSPRKMRLIADLIRGQRVEKALHILKTNAKQPSENAYANCCFQPSPTGRPKTKVYVSRTAICL